RLPRHRPVQAHAHLVLGHDRDLALVDLLCQRKARFVHAGLRRQTAVVLTHIGLLVPAVEAEVEAFAVAGAHAAESGRERVPHGQAAAGIIKEWAVLHTAHGLVHGGFLLWGSGARARRFWGRPRPRPLFAYYIKSRPAPQGRPGAVLKKRQNL